MDELIEAGATYRDLGLMSSGADLSEAAQLITEKLYADRAQQMLLCGVWIGGLFVSLVGFFTEVTSIHDSVYTASDWFAVAGLLFLSFASAAAARVRFLEARTTMHKLLAIRRVLARWRRR